jgi:hypothetical protein
MREENTIGYTLSLTTLNEIFDGAKSDLIFSMGT